MGCRCISWKKNYIFCKCAVWRPRRICALWKLCTDLKATSDSDNHTNSFYFTLFMQYHSEYQELPKQRTKNAGGNKRGVCPQTPRGLEQWGCHLKKGSQLWARLWWIYTSLANRLSEIPTMFQSKTGETHMVSKESLIKYVKFNLTINFLNHVYPYKK